MGFIPKGQALLSVLFNRLMRNTKVPIIYNKWVSPVYSHPNRVTQRAAEDYPSAEHLHPRGKPSWFYV